MPPPPVENKLVRHWFCESNGELQGGTIVDSTDEWILDAYRRCDIYIQKLPDEDKDRVDALIKASEAPNWKPYVITYTKLSGTCEVDPFEDPFKDDNEFGNLGDKLSNGIYEIEAIFKELKSQGISQSGVAELRSYMNKEKFFASTVVKEILKWNNPAFIPLLAEIADNYCNDFVGKEAQEAIEILKAK